MFTTYAIMHGDNPGLEEIQSYDNIREAIDDVLDSFWEDDNPCPIHVVDAASRVVAILCAGLKFSSHDGLVNVLFPTCGLEQYRVTYELEWRCDTSLPDGGDWHYVSTTVVLLEDETAAN